MAEVIDYMEAAILCEVTQKQDKVSKGFKLHSQLLTDLESVVNFQISADDLEKILDRFVEKEIVTLIEDELAGTFFKLDHTRASNVRNEQYKIVNSIVSKYVTIGPQFINAVLENNQNADNDFSDLEIKSLDIPAADRIVSLEHNRVSELEKPTSDLIEQLEADNGIPDEPGLRERLLGQIKAGRELIRATVFDAQIFYLSMVVGLKMLVDKYKDHAIGATASKLIDLIYELMGESLK